ncbi:MAG: hypothetical protein JXR19_08265, partial [Bacteroidia bacterium]
MNNITKTFKRFCFILAGVAVSQFTYGQSYCTSNATIAADSEIHNVKLEGTSTTIDNNSSTGTGCETYTDFSSTVSAADLSAGSEYTVEVEYGTCSQWDYCRDISVYIDYNQDFSFSANEEVGSSFSCGYTTSNITFTIPCNVSTGKTRMRIVLDEFNGASACGTYFYGETEDYTVDISKPTALSSNFFAPDTAFVGTIVNFINGSSGNITNDWDIDNDGAYDYNTANAKHIYTATGTYSVKLRNYNCAGTDSTVKQIVIVNPTA